MAFCALNFFARAPRPVGSKIDQPLQNRYLKFLHPHRAARLLQRHESSPDAYFRGKFRRRRRAHPSHPLFFKCQGAKFFIFCFYRFSTLFLHAFCAFFKDAGDLFGLI
jgi:hypothetical protein